MEIWRLTKQVFYLDLYFFLAILIPLTGIVISGLSFWPLVGILFGFFSWTIFEYSLHRWVFHSGGLLENSHWLHHQLPNGYIGAPNWVSIGVFAFIFGAIWYWVDLVVTSGFMLGFVLGYLNYLLVHHMSHHHNIRQGRWWYKLTGHHKCHHGFAGANYGISTMWIDRLLGSKM